MNITPKKIDLLKKIISSRLTKEEMQSVIAKAEEISQRRKAKRV